MSEGRVDTHIVDRNTHITYPTQNEREVENGLG